MCGNVRCDRCAALLFEIVRDERSALIVFVPVAIGRLDAAHFEFRKKRASAHGHDLPVIAFVDGKCENAAFDAVEVDFDPRRFLGFFLLFVGLLAFVIVFAMNRSRLGRKRIRHVRAQREQEGPLRLRKAQIELQRIVDRIEIARGNEIEIFAFGIPSRTLVHAHARRHVVGFAGFAFRDAHDRHVVRARPPDVREPAAVRRKREIRDAVAQTLVQHAHRSVPVEQAKLVPVICKCDAIVDW